LVVGEERRGWVGCATWVLHLVFVVVSFKVKDSDVEEKKDEKKEFNKLEHMNRTELRTT